MKKKIFSLTLLFSILLMTFIGCKKDTPAPAPLPTIVKEWTVPLSAKNENPAPAGRTETGTAAIKLLSDNSISYTINVSGLIAGDALVAAHIHGGDVISNGSVVLSFNPVFAGSAATGAISNVRGTFIDSLKSDVNELYFNVHSTLLPGGLLRGQLNIGLEMTADVALSGTNEVPGVTTTATGIALLRLTTDKKLYSKITVTNVEAGDALLAAHIHKAAVGVNGGVIIALCANAADFGVIKISTVTDAVFASIKADPVYVNAHSVNHAGGIIRGQIR